MIYHYTTLRDFMGMVHFRDDDEFEKTKATNYDVDWSNYLVLNVRDVRMINSKHENDIVHSVLEKEVSGEATVSHSFGSVYSIPFCRQKDYIPMWDMCVQEVGDVGICLGFSTAELEDAVRKINDESFPELKLGGCKYMTESELESQLKDDVKALCGTAEMDVPINSDEIQEKLRQMMVKSAFYRLKDFEYEQETRLVGTLGRGSVKEERGVDGTSVKIKIPSRSFKEIIIGPRTRNKDIVEMGIEALLSNKSYRKKEKYGIDIKVEQSKLELR